jgi:hypothetical protein
MRDTFRFQQARVGRERVVMEGAIDGFEREVYNLDQERSNRSPHYSDTSDDDCPLHRGSHEIRSNRNSGIRDPGLSRTEDEGERDDCIKFRQHSGVEIHTDFDVRGQERRPRR